MAEKLHGRAIQPNTIPADRIVSGSLDTAKFDNTTAVVLGDSASPKIRTLTYFGANTTANINGGQTLVISGSNFEPNVTVYINTTVAPSVTRTNANSISFTTPALSAGTYLLYVINPDGGFGTFAAPGIVYL